ncbi:hypothetical protein QZH41_010132, partial [Actinostola sp. cb2023]
MENDKNYTTTNIHTGKPMIFMMDPKHNIKKIRNNISKSGSNKPRNLTVNGKAIMWNHFTNAYKFDQTAMSLSLHERLTEENFELSSSSKMRIHLTEDVLDSKMLYLMKAYRNTLKAPGEEETGQ